MSERPIREAAGCKINFVRDEDGHVRDAHGSAPGKANILTFDLLCSKPLQYEAVFVEGVKRTLLVLDPYGDEISDRIRERIFGKSEQWALCIDRATGAIFIVTLSLSESDVASPGFWTLNLRPWMPLECSGSVQYRIPAEYLSRLHELKNKKRPYSVYVEPYALQDVVEGEHGYDHLRQNVIFTFAFDGGDVEVQRDSFRVVGEWKSLP